jgi:hypothetical protein
MTSWLDDIKSTFEKEGIIGHRLTEIIRKEQEYKYYIVSKFRGYNILMDAFLSFFIETFDAVSRQFKENEKIDNVKYYNAIVAEQVMNFRSFRAAENLLLCGYPQAGYILFRDLKDRAIFMAAIILGLTSYSAIYGIDQFAGKQSGMDKEVYGKAIKKRKMEEENHIKNHILKGKSGFDQVTIKALKKWEETFHYEVHGSRLSKAQNDVYQFLMEKKPLKIAPLPNDEVIYFYMNRSNEVAWMLLRTLPYLQFKPKSFGNEWAEKWHVLDISFQKGIKEIADQGKPFFLAIIKLITEKFQFFPNDCTYIDRTP